MGADQNIDWRSAAASTLDWWHEAGVETLVDDTPRAWLREPRAAEARPADQIAATAPAQPTALPDPIDAFEAWRIGPGAPEAGWPGSPIATIGRASSRERVCQDV